MSAIQHPVPSRWLAAAVVFSSALLNGAMSFAQAVKEDTPDPEFKVAARAMGSDKARDAGRMLTGQAEMDGAETLFTSLLEKGIYPHFTHKENLASWTKMKTQVKQKLFNPAKVQAALDLLNQITLRKMNEYATDNYHIVARYQAMIFVGELNQSLPGRQVVPMPEALPVMLKAASDSQLPTAVRVAALLGIKRHADTTLPDEAKKQVANTMLALVKTKEPAGGESQEGQDWLRRRAADIAATLGVNAPEVKEVLAMNAAAAGFPATAASILVPLPDPAMFNGKKKDGSAPGDDPFGTESPK